MSSLNIELGIYITISMVMLFGGIVGIANYFKQYIHFDAEAPKPSVRRAVANAFVGGITTLIVFACLSEFTEVSYTFKLGISTAVAFYGLDKVVEVFSKISNIASSFKGGNNDKPNA